MTSLPAGITGMIDRCTGKKDDSNMFGYLGTSGGVQKNKIEKEEKGLNMRQL